MSLATQYYEKVVRDDVVRLDKGKAGMIAFLCTEVAFFSSLFVAYVVYIGKSISGPTPAEVLDLWPAIINTVLLLSSSFTMAQASASFAADRRGRFYTWLPLTMALAVGFLVVTSIEWYGLIFRDHLEIYSNLFGTTYYTLVGFHSAHVAMGLVLMAALLGTALRGRLTGHATAVELVAWYWHFVDTVWIGIFLVVYLLGR